MKRVALFGGSFNPPHVAHQLAALYVLETQPVDELWFVPVFAHVFGKPLAPFADRVAMCELAAAALGPRVRVCRAEHDLARQRGPAFAGSRTLDLIEYLQASEPVALRLVIGTDILAETAKWHRWDDVVAAAPLIVLGRAGHMPTGSVSTGVTLPEISSTEVRARLAAGPPEAVAALVPTAVLRYIAERALYSPP